MPLLRRCTARIASSVTAVATGLLFVGLVVGLQAQVRGPQAAANYVVDTFGWSGSDSYTGNSQEKPFATLGTIEALAPAGTTPRIKLRYPDGSWRDAPPVWRGLVSLWEPVMGLDPYVIYDVANAHHGSFRITTADVDWWQNGDYISLTTGATPIRTSRVDVDRKIPVINEYATVFNFLHNPSPGATIIAVVKIAGAGSNAGYTILGSRCTTTSYGVNFLYDNRSSIPRTKALRLIVGRGESGVASLDSAADNQVMNTGWHVLAVTYTSAKEVKFYVDGVETAGTNSGGLGAFVSNDAVNSPRISSCTSDGTTNALTNTSGSIGSTLIYNRALSTAEMTQISSHLTARLPTGTYVNRLSLETSLFQFNESFNSAVSDQNRWRQWVNEPNSYYVGTPPPDNAPSPITAALDPLGGMTARLLTEGVANYVAGIGPFQRYQSGLTGWSTESHNYVFSVYVKANTITWANIIIGDINAFNCWLDPPLFANCAASNYPSPTYFNMSTGVVGNNSTGNTSVMTDCSAAGACPDIPLGAAGWYRISVSRAKDATGARTSVAAGIRTSRVNGVTDTYSDYKPTGTALSMYIWRPQFEFGTTPTAWQRSLFQ